MNDQSIPDSPELAVLKRQIAELEAREARIQADYEHLKQLYERAPLAYQSLDSAGCFIAINQAWADTLGYAKEEVLGRNFGDFLHPDWKDHFKENFPRFKAIGEILGIEFEMVRKDGSTILVSFHGKIGKDPLGHFQQTHCIFHDITKQKQDEEALRESEERWRRAITASPIPIMIHDEDDRVLQLSAGWTHYSGYTIEDIPFLSDWTERAFGERTGSKKDYIDQLFSINKTERNGEWIVTAKDGSKRIWEFQTTPLGRVHGGKRVLHSMAIDITEPRRMEEERSKLESQLHQVQKMESVGRLAGGVAHDFNNMLGAILGYTEMAMELVEPDNPLHANLERIQGAAQRSAKLTRQLLAFARKQTVSPKVIDLNDTIESMLKLLVRLIGENIDLAWRPGKDVWPVNIDPTQIDQILANLCVNARDAIVDTGKVTIETGIASFDEEYCSRHAGYVPGDYVLLAVSDTGCGMDKETQTHLFEPFFTTKEVGKGTGLGSATVYGTVKQNNGFINVYSELGQGTTFRIYLPRHLAKTVPLPEKKPDTTGERGHETVLLVEDESVILEMTKIMLEKLGYTVLAAGTPGEAIRLAQEHPGRIDLLLTDVVMPEMNGRDLAKNLLSIYPDIRRLFMSGYTANVIAHSGVLDEGVNFIQKPFTRHDLAAKIRQALD